MKLLLSAAAVGLGLLLASCGRSISPPGASPPAGAGFYQPGKGLLLSKAMQDSLGVEMTEVEERTLGTSSTATAQVYRGAEEADSRDGAYRAGIAYASATVPAETARGMKSGQAVTVRAHAASATPRLARIHRLDDMLQKTMGTQEVLLAVPDPEKRLAVGSFLTVEFALDGNAAVIVVPRSAVLLPVGGACVYVRNSQHLLRTGIKTGSRDAQWVEIRDGLLPGDMVVSRGAADLWLVELRATQGGGGCGCQ